MPFEQLLFATIDVKYYESFSMFHITLYLLLTSPIQAWKLLKFDGNLYQCCIQVLVPSTYVFGDYNEKSWSRFCDVNEIIFLPISMFNLLYF